MPRRVPPLPFSRSAAAVAAPRRVSDAMASAKKGESGGAGAGAPLQLHVTFVVNANAGKKSAMIWKTTAAPLLDTAATAAASADGKSAPAPAPAMVGTGAAGAARAAHARAQLKDLLTHAKNKLGLRKKPQRLFVTASGQELGVESIAVIVQSAAAAPGAALTLAVSVGEDFAGTVTAPPIPLPSASAGAGAAGGVAAAAAGVAAGASGPGSGAAKKGKGKPKTDAERVVSRTLDAHGVWFNAQWVLLTHAVRSSGVVTVAPASASAAAEVAAATASDALAALVAAYASDVPPQPIDPFDDDADNGGSGQSISAGNKAAARIARSLKASRSSKSTADARIDKIAETYEQLVQQCSVQLPKPPPGLCMTDLRVPVTRELVAQALAEADAIFAQLANRLTYLDFTNLRFTIETGDFNRSASDPWPMLPFADPRVARLGQLMTAVTRVFGGEVSAVASPRLNAIVRRYRPGDVIGFHVDRKEYTDEIFGVVLQNADPSRGLLFHRQGHPPFMASEAAGLALCFRGAARTEWVHGFAAAQASDLPPGTSIARTSISFRFFSDAKSAPPYDHKHDI